ncbi:MAG: glycosyltransferase [Deltaproteobacteria bacterium]|jgi:spore maturation protein CgeB|nr:glycosyltransferase [Deltaproteobacteria bacterium]
MNDMPLRVLVVLPMYGGSLPIGRYCAQALRDLGHTVDVFDAPAFHGAFSAVRGLQVTGERLRQLENAFLQVISQAVQAKAEQFAPDLTLALAQAPLTRQTLKRMERQGMVTAMWFVEDYKLFTYWRAFAPCYDIFAVIQKEPLLSELAAAGQPNGLYLPLAALPGFHAPQKPEPAVQRKYGAKLSFLGAGYPNRRAAFRQLRHLDFKIWGSDWEGDESLAAHVQQQGARISPEEAVRIYSASRINLNLHSSVQTRELVPPGDFVNPRTFELAACGAFQLVDRRELMPELFADDEVAGFSSMQELLERIDYFLARPAERAAFAERGRQRVLRDHTYHKRMDTLIGFIRERKAGWPARARGEGLPADLPPGLRADLADLLAGLGLPENAPLEDVMLRLRQRSGVLSPLETNLLFLDEWRKLYTKNAR